VVERGVFEWNEYVHAEQFRAAICQRDERNVAIRGR